MLILLPNWYLGDRASSWVEMSRIFWIGTYKCLNMAMIGWLAHARSQILYTEAPDGPDGPSNRSGPSKMKLYK